MEVTDQNKNQGETFVFGGKPPENPPVVNKEVEKVIEQPVKKEEIIDKNPPKATEEVNKVIDDSIQKEVVKPELNKDSKEVKRPIEISFKKSNDPIKQPEPQTKETSEVTEEVVMKWLNEKGIKADKLSELSKKEELSESVAKFDKFVKETGRNHEDFFNAQKDWSKESKDDTIKEFYKYSQKNISDEDIEDRIDLLRVTQDDEDDLGDRELRQRKLDYNSEYAKALEFMNNKTKEYSTPLKSAVQQKAPTTEEIAEAYKPYWDKRDKSLAKLTDVEFSVDGIGDIKLNVTAEHKQKISEITQTQESLVNRWADKDGKIDTDRSSEDTMWSIPEIRNEFIASMMEQAQALVLENFSKEKRNVTLGKEKHEKIIQQNGAFQVIGDRQSSNAGKPLI